MKPAFAESQSCIKLLSLLDCAIVAFAKNNVTKENNNDRMMRGTEYFFIIVCFYLYDWNMNLIVKLFKKISNCKDYYLQLLCNGLYYFKAGKLY